MLADPCRPCLPAFLRPFSSSSNSGQKLEAGTSSLSQGSIEQQLSTGASLPEDVPLPVDGVAAAVQQQLSEEQQQELRSVLMRSFRADPSGASAILSTALNKAARRELLSSLEDKEPELSREAMVADAAYATDHAPPDIVMQPAVAAAAAAEEPTFRQLLRVAVTRGLPFVAFGFFDNIIMITAGEQIDAMFGAKLGLSSMAAAGLGNTVADVVGINISHTIEHKFKGMQSMAPGLTKAQLQLPQTRRAKWLGCALGMASGCLLGLTPLLFYGTDHKAEEPPCKEQTTQQTAAAAAAVGAG